MAKDKSKKKADDVEETKSKKKGKAEEVAPKKGKKADDSKAEKASKKSKGSTADDDFAKPSEAPAGGDGWSMTDEAEGKLLLITPLKQDEVETKDFGTKPVIVCDVVVIDEKKPAKSEVHTDVFVFGGYLRGALRGFIGERRVLARLVQGTKKERGNYPWLFEDATEKEMAIAREYLASVDPFEQDGKKAKKK